ncbi:MAG: tetratricopeptide repeat protein, partial [Pirellula sp.]
GAQGAKPSEIKRQLYEFGNRIENRSLLELDLVFDGRRILLRDQGKLFGAHGQLHLDFDLDASESEDESSNSNTNIRSIQVHEPIHDDALLVGPRETSDLEPWSRDDMLHAAEELEDAGRIEEAIEWYRVILSKYGPNADIAFQLAELLYRSGDLGAARERYYNAVEIDEDFVEARANLGCVLAELGQIELAIAAFEGALARDDRYPDVHYHLARSLDEVGKSDQATRHWVRFLQLSPQSPWADEALERLGKL